MNSQMQSSWIIYIDIIGVQRYLSISRSVMEPQPNTCNEFLLGQYIWHKILQVLSEWTYRLNLNLICESCFEAETTIFLARRLSGVPNKWILVSANENTINKSTYFQEHP